MAVPQLGRLVAVDPRNIWTSESGDFTPWLAQEENIALLSEALGLDLELEAQEKNVGPFRADILCKDTATNAWVLIENQLERTDHAHLGQLLTYAAGLEAVTIVWVAKTFTEEHRATLDWLNEITDDRFNFFGIEIEAWRVGDSQPAPKFNIVSKPNDWTKEVTRGLTTLNELTPAKQLQLDYWTAFSNYLRDVKALVRPTKPLPQAWMNLALGRAGIYLVAIASHFDSESQSFDANELRAEVVFSIQNAKRYFQALEVHKAEIERGLGESLVWHNPADKKSCKVYLRRPANLSDRADWPQQHAWLRTKLERLHQVVGPIVKELEPATGAATVGE